jgi:hypothetical protein
MIIKHLNVNKQTNDRQKKKVKNKIKTVFNLDRFRLKKGRTQFWTVLGKKRSTKCSLCESSFVEVDIRTEE